MKKIYIYLIILVLLVQERKANCAEWRKLESDCGSYCLKVLRPVLDHTKALQDQIYDLNQQTESSKTIHKEADVNYNRLETKMEDLLDIKLNGDFLKKLQNIENQLEKLDILETKLNRNSDFLLKVRNIEELLMEKFEVIEIGFQKQHNYFKQNLKQLKERIDVIETKLETKFDLTGKTTDIALESSQNSSADLKNIEHLPQKKIYFLDKNIEEKLENQSRITESAAEMQVDNFADPMSNLTVPKSIEHDQNVGQVFRASELSVRLATSEQRRPKPASTEELGFGKHFTDHMLKIYYDKSLGGWQKPEIMPLENLVMHPAAKVLHYAVELFEGMKAYRGVDGKIRIFRPDMNMQRMNLAAQRSGLPTFEGGELLECLSRLLTIDAEWVPHTEAASLYIRPTLIGIEPTLGIDASDTALLYSILSPVGSYFNGAVSLLADPSYTRAWPGGVGNRKMGSNYAPTIHVQREAAARGLQQVLWLYGEDHQLTEVGTMNIFMFYVNDRGEQELITPPLNGLILPGITRDSILIMAREWGKFQVTEGVFTMPMVVELLEQGRLLELFGTGTACVVSPINRISYMGRDLYIPTKEQEKPVHELIRQTLTDIQFGKMDHPWAVVIV